VNRLRYWLNRLALNWSITMVTTKVGRPGAMFDGGSGARSGAAAASVVWARAGVAPSTRRAETIAVVDFTGGRSDDLTAP
jgi:hypothetical protein